MSRLVRPYLVFAIFLFAGCTHQQLYQTMQNRQQLDCQKLQMEQYEECMKQYSESYEKYKSDRDKLLEDK